MSWNVYLVYVLVIGTLGGLAIWRLRRRLHSTEGERKSRLDDLHRFDAIRTRSPVDDPTGQALQRGKESIAARFTLIRRIVLPSVLAMALILVALPLLSDMPATLLSLVVAVVGVVAGIAAKPFLENLIAGVVISFSRPIRLGDTVLVDGHFGTVEDLSFTHTTIKVWDWRRYMVPNHRMMEKEFVNYSIVDRFQWAYVEFWVAADADIEEVRRIAVAGAKTSAHFAPYEEPRFWVMETGKEGIRCWVAAWAETPSAAWLLTHDIRTELVQQFRRAGIRTHTHVLSLDNGIPAPVSNLGFVTGHPETV